MQELPKGQSQEHTTGRPENKPGKYVNKELGTVIYTAPGAEGTVMADAIVRQGYVREGDTVSREEALAMQKAQADKETAEAGSENAKAKK